MNRFNGVRFLVLFAAAVLLFQKSAYAYLDPGSGSYILQLLVAASVACIFAIKMFFAQIKLFFSSIFSKKNKKSKDGKSS